MPLPTRLPPAGPASSPRSRSWTSWGGTRRSPVLVLLAFVLLYGTLEMLSIRMKSATWDESIHLAAGHAMLANGDYRVDATHPPFLRLWGALPLLAMGVESDTSIIDRTPVREWQTRAYSYAHRFLFVDQDADTLLFAARSMVIVWGIVLGVLLFSWAREWLGYPAALLALGFYAIEPNLGAHARLMTTDIGATCFFFATVYFLWRTWRQASPWNVTALTLSFALANVTKFSGVILAPVLLLAFAVPGGLGSRFGLRACIGLLALLAAGTFLAIWAVYGFRYAPSDSSEWLLRVQDRSVVRENAPLMATILGWIDAHRLLPNHYTQGFLFGQASAEALPAYLAGEVSESAAWYYFPAAFLLKTPVALLVLLGAGLVVCAARRREMGLGNLAFVLLPVVLYLAIAMASRISLGLRHILPVYPFALLVAAASAQWLMAWRRPLGRLALVGLTASWLVTYARVYPHTLTFFNVVAGGPGNGLAWLADSNLDWGQDLKLLKRWMDEQHVRHVNLAYFGTADPRYYGIDCTHLPCGPFFASPLVRKPVLPGYVALSATLQSGVYLRPQWRVFYSGFRTETPVAVIGNTISVYWVESWPEGDEETEAGIAAAMDDPTIQAQLADALAFDLDWPEQALPHYEAVLEARPEDSRTLGKIGVVLVAIGRAEEAIGALQRAVAADPDNAEAQCQLGSTLLKCNRPAEALAPAQAAVRLLPDDPFAHDLLGVSLAFGGYYDAAQASFERALQVSPGYAPALEHVEELREWRKR